MSHILLNFPAFVKQKPIEDWDVKEVQMFLKYFFKEQSSKDKDFCGDEKEFPFISGEQLSTFPLEFFIDRHKGLGDVLFYTIGQFKKEQSKFYFFFLIF